jgi:Flp pilus assembly protein TadG
MSKRSITSLWNDSEGSVLIEATVLTPVLVMLMFGLFEFSWYFHKQQLVETGIRDAARYLSRVAQDGTDPCTVTDPTTNVLFKDQAKNIAVTGVVTGGSPRVSGWKTGDVTILCSIFSNSTHTYDGATNIYIVTASTNFADPNLGYFGLLHLTAPRLTASHAERSLGPG